MNGAIFLLQADDQLVPMTEQAYDSEALLQQLLARHPSLLAGDQMNGSVSRRWLLVSREMSVPDSEDGPGRWHLDHLFLDQDGVPTLVEVKRSTDTRIRREVVGQMLDYAANAVLHWPVAGIRAQTESRCQAEGLEVEDALRGQLGLETDPEDFWRTVETNLQAGRIRLVFVADVIPIELRRIIEFLNRQMIPAEVLGVEVRQYMGQGLRTLVPRVVGQTADKEKGGAPRETRQWDEDSFFQLLKEKRGAAETEVAQRILQWSRQNMTRITWGSGKQDGSFIPVLEYGAETFYPVAVYTYGRAEIQFQWIKSRPPFDDEIVRRELLRRLNEIPGVSLPDDAISRRPRIELQTLTSPDALQKFFEVLNWTLEQIETHKATEPA
jgi:hypothetical protein